MNWAVWIFGACGVLANFFVYQQTTRKNLLIVKMVSDVCWTLHYAFLGAYSGSGVAAVGILRETVFMNRDRKWARGKWWLIVFIVLGAVLTLLTWKGWLSVFPLVGSVIAVISFWKGNPKLTKLLAFPISACYITYDIIYLSYLGLVNEAFILISSIIGLIRLNKQGEVGQAARDSP